MKINVAFTFVIYRFLKAASIIKKNLSLFQSVCYHVDIITTIIEYLNNVGVKLMFNNKYGNIMFIIAIENDMLILFVLYKFYLVCE